MGDNQIARPYGNKTGTTGQVPEIRHDLRAFLRIAQTASQTEMVR